MRLSEAGFRRGLTDYSGVLACMLATYAVAVYCRLGVVDLHQRTTTLDITTADGYGWLTAVSGLGASRDHALAQIGRLVLEVGWMDESALGLYGPVFVGSLAAPLIVYWGCRNANLSGGIFAGILGLQLPAIFSRTGFGYFDSDAVIVPLLMLVVICFQSWFELVKRRLDRNDSPGFALFGVTATLGFGLYLAGHIHVLFFFNSVALAIVGLWLCPRLGVFCLYILLVALFGPAGVVVALVLYWLISLNHEVSKGLRSYMYRHRVAGVVALIVLVGMFVWISEATGTLDLIDRVRTYAYEPLERIWSDDPGAVSVQELGLLDAKSALQLVTGNVFLSVLGLGGVAAAIVMSRNTLFFLFPLILGLSAPATGKRFAMFASLVIILAAAVVLSRLVNHLTRNRGIQCGILGMLASLYCYQLFQIYQSNPPNASGAVQVKQALQKFGGDPGTQRCNLLLTSWGKGYMAAYYTKMPAILDGSSHPVESLRMYGKMMLASDDLTAQRHACELLERQESFVDRQLDDFDCEVSPGGVSALYIVVTWDDLMNVSRLIRYADWAGAIGESHVEFEAVPKFDLEAGLIEVGGESFGLASIDVVSDAGARTRKYQHRSARHMIVNRTMDSALVVDDALYHSFALKTFLGRREVGFTGEVQRGASTAIAVAPLDDLCRRE